MLNQNTYSAPSNIAIIKYMGKTSPDQNLPTNPSISYTLEHLRSHVSLTSIQGTKDLWEPLHGPHLLPMELSEKGRTKFLKHLIRIKDLFGIKQSFLVKSANNFPSDCGIASSSSSFAALTLAAFTEFQKISTIENVADSQQLLIGMSKISRFGSGSSCRSFFSPWAAWDGEGARPWNGRFTNLNHSVMLLDSSKKEVSSSDAHIRVTTSTLFPKRLENVTTRLKKIEQANRDGNWNLFCMLAIEEFEEMHQLFETSQPAFSYRNDHTLLALKQLEKINAKLEDKLLITMDAGNNIHVMTLKHNRKDLENLETLFPDVRFVNSWSFQEGTRA